MGEIFPGKPIYIYVYIPFIGTVAQTSFIRIVQTHFVGNENHGKCQKKTEMKSSKEMTGEKDRRLVYIKVVY